MHAQQDEDRAAAAGLPDGTPAERIIYLPFDKLPNLLDQQNSSVIIPYADYLKLWTAAEDGGLPGEKVDAVITRADYVATIEADTARIKAQLRIDVVGQPWVSVPLNFGEAAVADVSSETGEVLLQGTGEGTYTLLLKDRGEQQVSIELTTRVVTSPDGREISFATPTVAVSTLEVVIPQADQEVEVRPRLIQRIVGDGGETTRIKASLGATGQVTAQWHARASDKPQMDLLASVTNLQQVRIADGLIHTDATLEFNILRGELEQLRVAVPKDCRVLDVTATARIQRWQTTEEASQQIVTIDLLSPATEDLTVEVHTEAKLGEGTLSLAGIDGSGTTHGIHALDVIRERGQLVVTHGEELTLRIVDQSGLGRIAAEEVAEPIRQASGLAYQFFNPQFTLTAVAEPVEPRVTVRNAARIEIGEEQLTLTSDLGYTIERAGLFELQLRLPAGLNDVRVDSDAMEKYRVDDDLLTVSLQQQLIGDVALRVTAEQDLPPDGETFDLPLLEPLGVEREVGSVALLAPDAVEVATSDDELIAALPDPLGAQQRLPHLRASWRFTRRPVRIPVTITRKPTRLSAQVATSVDVQPTRTRVTTQVDFLVEYAGIDTFRIDIPDVATPTLQIDAVPSSPTSPALREKTAADPADGWVTHTLTMQRPLTGTQRFRITYDLQPTEVTPADLTAADSAAGTTPADDAADSGDAGADDDRTDADSEPNDTQGDDSPAKDSPSEDASETSDDAETTDGAQDNATDAANSDGAPADDDGDTGAATPNDATDTDEDSGTELDSDQSDVPQFQTTLWIIRPLGVEAEDDKPATPLTAVTGEIQLDKEESLTITARATGADVEPIDVRELRQLPQTGTLAFRYRQHADDETIEVTITQARYEIQEMLATVVSRALVEVMLGEDETATYRCRYRITSTERQRLELQLPQGIVPLSVLVNDSEVRLEPVRIGTDQKVDTYYVNVSRTGESDEPFHLSLQFLLSFSEPPFDTGFMRGRITLPLPVIGASDGSAATQELRTIVWVPEDYALIGNPSGFVLDGATHLWSAILGGPKRHFSSHDDESWVGYSASGLDFPTAGRVQYRYTNLGGQEQIKLLWWDTVNVTIVVSVTLAVIALLLVRTDWENKLGILLLIAFGAMLLGLKDMHVLAHALSAMRFGLLFMIGLWILHALFGHRPHRVAITPHTPTGVTSATPPHAAAVPPPGIFDHFLSPKSDRDDDFK